MTTTGLNSELEARQQASSYILPLGDGGGSGDTHDSSRALKPEGALGNLRAS